MTDHGAEGGVNERTKFFLAAKQNNLILAHCYMKLQVHAV